MCIFQPFSPLLFARGPSKGPGRLIRKLYGQSTAENVLEELHRDNAESAIPEKLDPMISLRATDVLPAASKAKKPCTS